MKAVSALPGGGPVRMLFQYALASPSRPARTSGLGKAGAAIIAHEEHAAVADAKHHLALEWAAFHTLTQDRGNRIKPSTIPVSSTQVFVMGTSRMRRIPTAICMFTFPKQNVLAVGDCRVGPGLARRRLVDRWVDCGHRRRPPTVCRTLANAGYTHRAARGPVLSLADLKAQFEMYGTIYDRLESASE